MPYYLEKGPMFSVIEDYLNANTARAVKMLRQLRRVPTDSDYVELWNLAPFGSTNLGAKPPPPYAEDFRVKWLGMGPGAAPMWDNYHGDVNGITRLTIRTALEVALGIPSDQAVSDTPPRHWPIDLFWKCGQNWFEGWVTHRRMDVGPPDGSTTAAGAGHVVVIFATPTDGSTVLDRPADHRLTRSGPDFEVNPTSIRIGGVERQAGSMVITHRHNEAQPSWDVDVIPIGQTFEVRLNPATYVGKQDLVIVAPSEADGGVLATPRPYVAP